MCHTPVSTSLGSVVDQLPISRVVRVCTWLPRQSCTNKCFSLTDRSHFSPSPCRRNWRLAGRESTRQLTKLHGKSPSLSHEGLRIDTKLNGTVSSEDYDVQCPAHPSCRFHYFFEALRDLLGFHGRHGDPSVRWHAGYHILSISSPTSATPPRRTAMHGQGRPDLSHLEIFDQITLVGGAAMSDPSLERGGRDDRTRCKCSQLLGRQGAGCLMPALVAHRKKKLKKEKPPAPRDPCRSLTTS